MNSLTLLSAEVLTDAADAVLTSASGLDDRAGYQAATTVVPLPAPALLLVSGLAGLAALRRRARRLARG